ncbi:metallophosphoesterase [Actinospica sp.]|jgi:predicted MPP superfamily phosphohydrolase|uniref:metallophosphoesterase n=1 Tax=Actinospica sp. TaxID=1872142 RepID=UPI002BBEFBCC|nr:metallophosphoesterase [Actinospica sp.]HWG24973.1 metallophosphoesterase [Actinospica sp.]
MRKSIAVPLGVAAVGLAGLGYAAGVEVNLYRLRRFELPVLDPGSAPVKILQVSDIHMVPGQRRKHAWLRSLAELEPDLVVNTGDNLSHPDAVGPVLDALEPLLRVPGVFVFGSNDYYRAKKLNPTKYLRRGDISHAPKHERAQNDWHELQAGLEKHGWLALNNARGAVQLRSGGPGSGTGDGGGRRIAFVGLDDPHVQRDRYESVAGGPDIDAEVTIGVTHAPYLRALDAMAADGLPVILAGHTHGGQLCVPFYGALVTNCDIDTARAKGLHTHTAPNDRTSYLHVSAGCGTSRFAPARFACPPEASLLTLVPRR